MVTLDKTCRTVNGLDINYLEEYKRSIKAYGEELLRDTADYYIKDFTEVLA